MKMFFQHFQPFSAFSAIFSHFQQLPCFRRRRTAALIRRWRRKGSSLTRNMFPLPSPPAALIQLPAMTRTRRRRRRRMKTEEEEQNENE